MITAVQLLAGGIAMGFIYCLIAIEYTLVFKTSGLMNFGHDKYIVFGAYVFAATFMLGLGWNSIFSIIGTLVTMFGLGIIIANVAFNPMRNLPPIYAVTGTMTLSLLIREIARLYYGAMPFTLPGFLRGTVKIGSLFLPKTYFFIVGTTVVLLILQYILLLRTKVGKAMRAVSQDKDTAALMGINVSRMLAATVGISISICGVIAILIVPLYGIDLSMTAMLGTKGFVAGIVGGFGSLNGAIAGGLFLGLVEALFLVLGGPGIYKDLVSFVLIIIFLNFRPKGILGGKNDLL